MPDFYWHLLGQLLIIVRFIYRYLLSSYQQVLSDMSENSHQCVIIGIAGASASGKSLIASTVYNELKEKVGDHQIGVITEDCYYNDQSHLSMEERVKTNYDHPNALDHDLLCDHLQMLMEGKSVEVPQYSYSEHTRMTETSTMTPKKVIILEGILLLTDPRLRNLMHASVFMDTPLDICLLRRLQRDVAERGRTMESVLVQYQKQYVQCSCNLLSHLSSMLILSFLAAVRTELRLMS